MCRIGATEYPASYEQYIGMVPDGNILATLESQMAELLAVLRFAGPKQNVHDLLALMRFQTGGSRPRCRDARKWAVREVLGHITDTERVLAHRVLPAARCIPGELPRVRDNDVIANAHFNGVPLAVLMDDFAAARHASLTLYASLDSRALLRRITIAGSEFTARALVWITAGHAFQYQADLRGFTSAAGIPSLTSTRACSTLEAPGELRPVAVTEFDVKRFGGGRALSLVALRVAWVTEQCHTSAARLGCRLNPLNHY